MKQLACLCVLSLLSTQMVQAHGNLSHRHAAGTLRIDRDGNQTLDLMFTLSLVGPRANLITARFDLNRDGQFSNQETRLFAKELNKEMLGGLQLSCVPAHPLSAKDIQYKANQKNPRSVVVAGLMKFSLGQQCPQLTISSPRGAQRKGLENLKVLLSAYPPVTLDDTNRIQFELKPGESKQILVSASKTL